MSRVKTVGNISISRTNRDEVIVRIEDEHSGDQILELTLTPAAYGLLCTGLCGIKGFMEVNTSANIAKEREVRSIVAEDIKRYQDKELTAKLVLEHFWGPGLGNEGWMISDNGTRSQQNNSKGHCYNIKRYVPATNPTNLEDMY